MPTSVRDRWLSSQEQVRTGFREAKNPKCHQCAKSKSTTEPTELRMHPYKPYKQQKYAAWWPEAVVRPPDDMALQYHRRKSSSAISEDIGDFIGNYIYIHGMTGPPRTPALTATALAYGATCTKQGLLAGAASAGAPQMHSRFLSLAHARMASKKSSTQATTSSIVQSSKYKLIISTKLSLSICRSNSWIQNTYDNRVKKNRKRKDYPSEEPPANYCRKYTLNGKIAWAKAQLGTNEIGMPSQQNTWHFESIRG